MCPVRGAQYKAARQLLSDLFDPVPLRPGRSLRIDNKYEPRGVVSRFLFSNPIAGWRRVAGRDSRTALDWAEDVKRLLDLDYPQAEPVTPVCDNLNTHSIGSLDKAFDAATAGCGWCTRR